MATDSLPASGGKKVESTVELPEKQPKVALIKVEEQVDMGLLHFLQRATSAALDSNPDYLLFEINTYGGELHSAFEITDLILAIDQCSTYAFVTQKAISAGALIALAADRIAMSTGTTIGDVAPIVQSQEGPQVLGEKIQSPLRAKFRTLAERNGYPSLLAQAMVTMELEVIAAYPKDTGAAVEYFLATDWKAMSDSAKQLFANSEVLVREGELLTMTDLEAQKLGFSSGSYSSLENFLSQRGWKVLETYTPNWSETLVRTLGKYAPILMLLGFGALYMELKTPGFGLFGLIGITCLALVFGAKYMVGLADHTEFILLALGATLFLLEIYVFPGTFFLALGGIALMGISLVLAMQSFTLPDPDMPWQMDQMVRNIVMTLGAALLALLAPLLSIKYVLPYMPKRVQVISDITLRDARVFEGTPDLQIGMIGRTKTDLRPFGKILVNGKLHEAKGREAFIPKSSLVRIVALEANRITVTKEESV